MRIWTNHDESMPADLKIRWRGALAVICLLGAIAAAPARAQDAGTHVSTHGKWDVYVAGNGADRVCYVASQPVKSVTNPKNVRRDPVFAFVSFRPGDSIRNEVSIKTGYPYKKGSTVTVSIGNDEFLMATEGDGAWLPDPADEKRMVAAMKAGETMAAEGMSWRGTTTLDTYSLIGITAALKALEEACK